MTTIDNINKVSPHKLAQVITDSMFSEDNADIVRDYIEERISNKRKNGDEPTIDDLAHYVVRGIGVGRIHSLLFRIRARDGRIHTSFLRTSDRRTGKRIANNPHAICGNT